MKTKKRTFLALFATIFLSTLLMAVPVFAESCGGAKTSILDCAENDNGTWPILRLVTEILFGIAAVGGTIGLIIAGVQYLTAKDSDDQVKAAKKRIFNTVIGIVFFVLIFGAFELLAPKGFESENVEIASISASTKSVKLEVSKKKKVSVSIEPAKAAMYHRINWSSSDEKIATVTKNGMIEGIKAGTTTVTASAGDGKEVEITVTVTEPEDDDDDDDDDEDTAKTSGNKTKPIASVQGDSTKVACASGTIDLGVENNAYLNGQKTSVRLCEIPNITNVSSASYSSNGHAVVNSRVSGAYYALAKRYSEQHSGNKLTVNESYRTNERQTYFYNCYTSQSCNNGNLAAKPGYSDYQLGLAIDFAGISSWNDSLSQWFYKNLADFGLERRVSSEYWHVDPQKAYY